MIANDTPNTIAPLRNVSLAAEALLGAMERPAHLPGMVVFYGPSGWGKTFAATYLANKYRAYYVECKSTWTKKALLGAILTEMGIKSATTLYAMADQVSEQLAVSGRPLIIDEMDHLVDKNAVEIVRDIYEGSNAPIMMIGEEQFPHKLSKWERFHNRILHWQPAQACDLADTAHLAKLYAPAITIESDLLEAINKASHGAVRRICVNINDIHREADRQGWDSVGAAQWGERPLSTGQAPKRRVY